MIVVDFDLEVFGGSGGFGTSANRGECQDTSAHISRAHQFSTPAPKNDYADRLYHNLSPSQTKVLIHQS